MQLGDVVRYRGSIVGLCGEVFAFGGTCTCDRPDCGDDGPRYELHQLDGEHLSHVRGESFALVEHPTREECRAVHWDCH